MTQMNLSAKQKQIHRQLRLVVAKRGRVEEGLISSLGLADASYYLWIKKVLLNSLYTTLMVESEEELKSVLIRKKEEGENTGLKLSIKIMASSPITSWKIEVEKVEAYNRFSFLGL